MNLLDFIDHPDLLGPFFAGSSWDRWRAVLRAAFALSMSERDLELFREVAGDRDPPQNPVRELVCAVGRGGGKDAIASAIAAFVALSVNPKRLRPGERATVLCLATDKEQAGIAHSYISAYFREVPLLASQVERETDTELELRNGASIIVGTANYRMPRGRTICEATYDECAFWYDDRYSNPAEEVDAAVSPGLMRYPGSIKILISSVNKRSGLFYERVTTCFGRDDPDTLVVIGESLKFNPTLDAAVIERELRRDPERAGAEYLCQWRSDLTQFLDRELVEQSIDTGIIVRPAQPGVIYCAFADPSGGRGDSFTAAITHAEGDMIILDCLVEHRAPFNPSEVVRNIAEVLRSYYLSEIRGDRYAAQWTVEGFAEVGIRYEASERDKSSLYLDALPLFTAGRVRLIDNDRLTHQLISLERRSSRVGRDIVSHPDHRNAHDDAANAVCGALVLAAVEAGPVLWHRRDLGDAVAWPCRADVVFASASADEKGIFCAFWATIRVGPKLILIDYWRKPLTWDLFHSVAGTIAVLAMAPEAGAVTGALLCPSVLASHAAAVGLPAYGELSDAMLTIDRDAVLLAAAAQVAIGQVRLAVPAQQTSKQLPNPLLELRPGAPPSAAQDAVLLGVGAMLDTYDKPLAWREAGI